MGPLLTECLEQKADAENPKCRLITLLIPSPACGSRIPLRARARKESFEKLKIPQPTRKLFPQPTREVDSHVCKLKTLTFQPNTGLLETEDHEWKESFTARSPLRYGSTALPRT